MSSSPPQSWIARLVSACLGLLGAAIAVNVAIHLIESIAVPLIVLVIVIGGLVALAISGRQWWWRHRADRW